MAAKQNTSIAAHFSLNDLHTLLNEIGAPSVGRGLAAGFLAWKIDLMISNRRRPKKEADEMVQDFVARVRKLKVLTGEMKKQAKARLDDYASSITQLSEAELRSRESWSRQLSESAGMDFKPNLDYSENRFKGSEVYRKRAQNFGSMDCLYEQLIEVEKNFLSFRKNGQHDASWSRSCVPVLAHCLRDAWKEAGHSRVAVKLVHVTLWAILKRIDGVETELDSIRKALPKSQAKKSEKKSEKLIP